MKTAELDLDQAPPISVPVVFFAVAPLALAAAGALMIERGAVLFASPWMPGALSLTHLGTLGLLGSVMLGALYQMCPVVAGAPVPAARLAWVVAPLWGVGVFALAGGLRWSHSGAVHLGEAALGLALVLAALPIGWALSRRAGRGPTVAGMRLAVVALVGVAVLGILMAQGHVTGQFPGDRALWIRAHLAVGVFGWVGGLLAAISWQIVPMFYLAPAASNVLRWVITVALAVGGLGAPLALVVGLPLAPMVALAALAAWVMHPILILVALARRRRRSGDPSITAWQLGMACGLICAGLAAPAWLADDPRFALSLGWLAIGGWAGLVVHGTLTRILPFLVWFHRYSHLAGLVDTPAMRSLLPPKVGRVGVWAHAAALPLGLLAIWARWDPAAWAAGALLVFAGGWMARWLVGLLRHLARAPTALP